MKLERMTPSQKRKDIWHLEFDDGGKMTVTTVIIADFSLYSGRELTDEEYAALTDASETARVRARALRILGARAMSERELHDRLLRKGETEESAAEAVAWLKRAGLLDDREYAASVVRHYAAGGYGARKIRDELYRRGISKELWDGALALLPEADAAIDKILADQLGADFEVDDVKKATNLLIRRGFLWEEIHDALRRYSDRIGEP